MVHFPVLKKGTLALWVMTIFFTMPIPVKVLFIHLVNF